MSEPILFPRERRSPRGPRRRLVGVVVPVYNEKHVLERSVRRLHDFLKTELSYDFVITIADNAGTDRTWDIARRLADALAPVRAVHLDRKGRGRALRHIWSASVADVVADVDVDLFTDLNGFLPLVTPLLSGHSDLAIGSRLARGAHTARGPKWEIISGCYNLLLRAVMRARFSDAQCGFKAARAEVVKALLPVVEDEEVVSSTPSCCCSPNESACGCKRLPCAGRRTSAQRGRELNPAGDVISEFVDEFPPHRR
ncbi:glycosyltransferase [Actinomadura nitritigenes]|uniref:glycosyltransferase n=1 Tax=Actinomadura nitritigenes TaxID=134602 RepID=UPI0036A9EFBB